eukprot:454115-Prymnesium_polylepis.1
MIGLQSSEVRSAAALSADGHWRILITDEDRRARQKMLAVICRRLCARRRKRVPPPRILPTSTRTISLPRESRGAVACLRARPVRVFTDPGSNPAVPDLLGDGSRRFHRRCARR